MNRHLGRALPPVAMMAVFVVGVSLFNSAKWIMLNESADVPLALLYFSRFMGIAVYPVAAVLFRNRPPRVESLLALVVSFNALYIFSLVATPLIHDARLAAVVTYVFTGGIYGVSTEIFVLLFAHVFSTCGPRRGAVMFAIMQLLSNSLVLLLSVFDFATLLSLRIAFIIVGLALVSLVVCGLLRGAFDFGAPLCCEGPLPDEAPAARRSFPDSLNSWSFFLLVGLAFQSLFGFNAQVSSESGSNFALYDAYTTIILLVFDVVLVAVVYIYGERFTFPAALGLIAALYACGFVFYSYAWQSNNPVSGALVRIGYDCSCVLFWLFTTRKACENPRRTYLYYSLQGTFLNVQCGRALGSFMVTLFDSQAALVMGTAQVSLFIVGMVCLGAFFFVCAEGADVFAGLGAAGASDGATRVAGTDAGRRLPSEADPEARASDVRAEAFCERLQLSQRECEVLVETLHGHNRASVAEKLGLSPDTVKHYLSRIYLKAGVSSKQELVSLVESEHVEPKATQG